MEKFSAFGWAADNQGCWWYRIGMPFGEMSRLGYDVSSSTNRPADENCDLLVGQRICMTAESDGPHKAVVEAWEHLRQRGRKLVYEVDDDLFHVDPENTKAFEYYSRPVVQEGMRRAIRAAHLVTVTREPLAEVIRQQTGHENVVVLPNCVDESLLSIERKPNERVTIGWGGSGTHDRDWRGVPLKRFLGRNPQVVFHTVGAPYGFDLGLAQIRDVRELQALNVQLRQLNQHFELADNWKHSTWIDDHQEYPKALKFDVGIIPLHDTAFNQSKSYIKALEMAALGIPVVASHAGPYPSFVQHGKTGFLVKRDHEWEKYLHQLVNDEDMRLEMGRNARELAKQHTIQANVHKWIDAYGSVL